MRIFTGTGDFLSFNIIIVRSLFSGDDSAAEKIPSGSPEIEVSLITLPLMQGDQGETNLINFRSIHAF